MIHYIKIVLKFCFAFGLLIWLIQSGKVDFTLIQKSFNNGYFWVLTFALLIIQAILSSIRWKLLLQHKSDQNLPVFRMIQLTWIGMFFSSILPGAVTGDLIKLVYAKELDNKLSKTYLILTSLMDRIIGLIGLLFVMGLTCIIYFNEILALSPQMKPILRVNMLLFIGVLIFFVSLFLPRRVQTHIHKVLEKVPAIGEKLVNLFEGYWSLGQDKKLIFKTILISMILQFSNICAFYAITFPFLPEGISLPYLFSIIPLGLIAVAIPISPAGLGVGHVAFATLFSFMNIDNGASLFNTFFVCYVLVNLLGIIPYLFNNKKVDMTEVNV